MIQDETFNLDVPGFDDFGNAITNFFVDGKTNRGPWAYMAPKSFWVHGQGLGLGLGQAYKKIDNTWVKTDMVPRQ